jgi:hypothetical protein
VLPFSLPFALPFLQRTTGAGNSCCHAPVGAFLSRGSAFPATPGQRIPWPG